jgi:hypothetical protein
VIGQGGGRCSGMTRGGVVEARGWSKQLGDEEAPDSS